VLNALIIPLTSVVAIKAPVSPLMTRDADATTPLAAKAPMANSTTTASSPKISHAAQCSSAFDDARGKREVPHDNHEDGRNNKGKKPERDGERDKEFEHEEGEEPLQAYAKRLHQVEWATAQIGEGPMDDDRVPKYAEHGPEQPQAQYRCTRGSALRSCHAGCHIRGRRRDCARRGECREVSGQH
jgi:hypothetical protein